MEDSFRNILIIISAIIIGAIFVHGLWTIRKNRNPYKLKPEKEQQGAEAESERGYDASGFDRDGVGQVRVVGSNALTGEIDNPPQEHEIPHQPAPAPDYSEEPLPADVQDKTEHIAQETDLDQVGTLNFETPSEPEMPSFSSTDTEIDEVSNEEVVSENAKTEEAVYQAPVTQPKPEKPKPKKRQNKAASALKRNQMEMNFGEEQAAEENKPALDPEVLVISVVMPENQVMSGAALLPCLLTLGMKYGDMNIFHRHQDNAGKGKVTFSLANMMNPGTFDLDAMESFATQGVSLFMTMPNAGDPFEVFEQMLNAAKHLAAEFNGQLLDDKRSVLTKQTEQHYQGRIREFDRKSRISAL